MDFINLDRTTGEAIAGGLIKSIKSAQLDPMNIRGQSYDGASAMSSGTTGVQGRIKQICPRATYIHCKAHVRSLAIDKSSELPEIKNVIGVINSVYLLF